MSDVLEGRRILVTRSRSQASTLAQELEKHGAIPILVPTIALAEPSSFSELDRAVGRLHHFHWLVFTSANAVQAFVERARHLGISARPQRIAVIGPATAQALLHAGIRPFLAPVLLPSKAVAESLAAALLPHISAGASHNASVPVLLVRAEKAPDLLPESLVAAGATVTIAAAYRNVLPDASVHLLESALANGAPQPDAVTFTSSSTARNLVALLEAAGLRLPPQALRISIGPVTTATLHELGIPPHFEALAANITSLVQAVAQAFTSTPG